MRSDSGCGITTQHTRCAATLLATLAVAGCTSAQAGRAEILDYVAARGALVRSETTFTGMRGRYASYRVRLESSTGLQASGRLLRPPPLDAGRRHPAVLLNDGRELNSLAIEYLPPDFGDIVVLSLDYPAEFPYAIRLRDVVRHRQRMRSAAERIPALFLLGAEHLSQRTDVDSARMAIAATSFAVPFATIAAAADERFRNVALIYGAGNLPGVLAANLDLRPAPLRRLAAWIAMRPFRTLAPERFVSHIAPRPVVMVNGIDDPQMPRAAVQALYDAAGEPKAIVWLRTGHLMPADSALIRTLVDTAMARMPVLHQ